MNMPYADTRLGGVVKWVIGDPREVNVSVPRELLDCVCYVCTQDNGKWTYGGTAFILTLPMYHSQFQHLYVITARHCIKALEASKRDVYLRINTNDGNARQYKIAGQWHYHESEAVDLAVLPLELPSDSGLRFSPLPYNTLLNDERSAFDTFGPGDEILVTGLFSMRYGTQRNYPIVRSGILSAMPDEPLIDDAKIPYQAYLAEIRSMGGLSGSPVFLVYRPAAPPTPGLKIPRDVPVMMPREYYLLGVIRGHWDLPRGPLEPVFGNEESINMGIAVVTPATELTEIIMSERLREERRKRESELRAEGAPVLD